MSDTDLDNFNLTRVSDVLGDVTSIGHDQDSESEVDDAELKELKTLIAQLKKHPGVVDKNENIERKAENLPEETKFSGKVDDSIPTVKYSREELLQMTISPMSTLAPPGWAEVVNGLPQMLLNLKNSPHFPSSIHKGSPAQFKTERNDLQLKKGQSLSFRDAFNSDEWCPDSRGAPPSFFRDSFNSEEKSLLFKRPLPSSRMIGRRGDDAYSQVMNGGRPPQSQGLKKDYGGLNGGNTEKQMKTGSDIGEEVKIKGNISLQIKTDSHKRPQIAMQGLSRSLFQRAVADLDKQKQKL